MDIHDLPKEALFSLLLQVDPKEIKIVCLSKIRKVREICNSEYFRETYKQKYRKVVFRGRKDLTEKDFQSLVGVYSVDLSETNIKDEDLKYLEGVSIINLSVTKVTDAGMKYLKGVNTIDLSGTKVTDLGLKYLRSTGTENFL